MRHEAAAAYEGKHREMLKQDHAQMMAEHAQLEARHERLVADLRGEAAGGWDGFDGGRPDGV